MSTLCTTGDTESKSGYTPGDSELVVKAKAFLQISSLLG